MTPRGERCLQCDRALPRHEHALADSSHGLPAGKYVRTVSFGYAGDGYFCSAVCGHAFAVACLRDVDGWNGGGRDNSQKEE